MQAQRANPIASASTRNAEAVMSAHLRAAYPINHDIPDQFARLLRLLDEATGNETRDETAKQ
jgi:hypothetical protein